MRKYLLFLFSLLAWNVISHAADGTVLVIDKIAPKNGAFVGVVDSSQTVTNVTNFNNNLSASDNTVQKALDTLDNMTISGGGGGSSTLAVKLNAVSISSPTAVINFVSPMLVTLAGATTAQVTVDTTSASGLMTNSSATATFQPIGSYLTTSSATANYLTLSSATATYFNKSSVYVASVTGNAAITISGTNNASAAAPVFSLNSSSVTLKGNTFNTGSNLLQLSGGLVPNSLVDGSSVTKQGVFVAGSNITLTPGSGNTTISAASALPVGPNNSVQFSSFGALSGSSNLTFSPTDYTYTLGWSSGTYYTQKFSYSRFVDQFFDTKYVIDQIFLPRNDGGSYIAPTYFLYASTSSARNTPTATGNAYLSLYPDDGCAGANLSASGTSGAGATVSVNCFGGYFSDNSITAQIGLSEGVPYTLSAQPLNVWGDSTSGGVLLRDADGFSPNDGVELKAPSAVDSIAGLDNLVLVLPSTGGAIGDVLKITSVSSNEYSLEFGAVTGGGGGGGTTIWSKLDGSALDNAVSTINVTAPLTASSSPSGQINIGVLSSSVTLQGNTFNTGSNLVQLSGGLIPNSLINGSSVTKQGVITAGSGISVTNGSGIVTIAATGSGITGTTTTISMTIDGQGSAIVAGSTRSITIPFQCVISSWSVVADASGSLAVHLASSTFNNYPTITNITGAGNGPSLSSQSKRGAAVSSWTQTTIDAGSVLAFVVDSASTVKWATIVLWVIR